jgi:hypothetical protein
LGFCFYGCFGARGREKGLGVSRSLEGFSGLRWSWSKLVRKVLEFLRGVFRCGFFMDGM